MKYSQFIAIASLAVSVAAAPAAELHAHNVHKRQDASVQVVTVAASPASTAASVTTSIASTSDTGDDDNSDDGSDESSSEAVSDSVTTTSPVSQVTATTSSSTSPSSSVVDSEDSSSSSAVSTSSATSSPSSSSSVDSVVSSSSPSSSESSSSPSSSSSSSSSSSTAVSSSSSGDISTSAVGSSSSLSNAVSAYASISGSFEDGVLDCSSFPSSQPGVLALNYLGFGGWSGLYNSASSSPGSCTEGTYCSYACQPGMSKSQWPSDQPSNGVSVGGLLCKSGKLYRTNTASSNLCEWGVDGAVVVSQLSSDVSICRTDYPGTENMVVPTIVSAGSTAALTTVDESTYYQWQGKGTSAQYYVNNAGISQSSGCVWGTSGSNVGNWAPLNFGAGHSNGITYLSLIPNPNNSNAANFNVKIIGDTGATINGDCKYENGVYSGGSSGCTVSVTSGRGMFVLY